MKYLIASIIIFISFFSSNVISGEADNKGLSCLIPHQENLFIWFSQGALLLHRIDYGNIEERKPPSTEVINTNIKYTSNLYEINWQDSRAKYSLNREHLSLLKTYKNIKLGLLPHNYDCNVHNNKQELKTFIQPFLEKAFMKYHLKLFLENKRKKKEEIKIYEQRLRNKI